MASCCEGIRRTFYFFWRPFVDGHVLHISSSLPLLALGLWRGVCGLALLSYPLVLSCTCLVLDGGTVPPDRLLFPFSFHAPQSYTYSCRWLQTPALRLPRRLSPFVLPLLA